MKQLLLVEDDPSVVRFAEFELADAGYQVTTVRTVGEGWKAVRQQRFDVAVIDIHLPGAFGWELIERVRRDPDLADLPIVVASGADDDAHVQAPALGCEFVPKPFDPAVLVRKLQEVTAASRRAQGWVEKRTVRASVMTESVRFEGNVHISPDHSRFSDAIEEVMKDDRGSIPMTDVTIKTLDGTKIGTDDYAQVLKTRITAILPLDD